MWISCLTACKWLIWWTILVFIDYNSTFKGFLGYFLSYICISCGQIPCVRGENNGLLIISNSGRTFLLIPTPLHHFLFVCGPQIELFTHNTMYFFRYIHIFLRKCLGEKLRVFYHVCQACTFAHSDVQSKQWTAVIYQLSLPASSG